MKKSKVFLLFGSIFLSQLVFSQQRTYRNLVLEGGGIKGVAYGGALFELENRGILQQIIRVGGTSAGAIQACLLAVGYNADEISTIIAETPIESFNDGGTVFKATPRLVKHYGWYEGDSFLKTIQKLIADKTNKPNLTFAELHELAKSIPYRDLYVTGVNLTKQKIEVFSYETYPNMSICDAVRISMSIPLYYQAVFLSPDGKVLDAPKPNEPYNVFVDGGMLMNYPIEIFDQTKYLSETEPNQENVSFCNMETIGLRLERCEQIDHETQLKDGLAPYEINDFGSFLGALYNVVMENVNISKVEDKKRTIYINDMNMSPRVRKIPEEEKQKMMLCGRQGVIEFLSRQ